MSNQTTTSEFLNALSLSTTLSFFVSVGSVWAFVRKRQKVSMAAITRPGRIGKGFWWLFQLPRYLYVAIGILAATYLGLVLATVLFGKENRPLPDFLVAYGERVASAGALFPIAVVIFLGILLWLDALTRLILTASSFLTQLCSDNSTLILGANGNSEAWHHANHLRNVDDPRALGLFLIEEKNLETLASEILSKIAQEPGHGADRAEEPPDSFSASERGNAAFWACTIEQIVTDGRMGIDIGKLHAAVLTAGEETDLFKPNQKDSQYYKEILKNVRSNLTKTSGGLLPEDATIADTLEKSGEILFKKYDCNAALLFSRGRYFWINSPLRRAARRLPQFPNLEPSAMGAQFLKLSTRWHVVIGRELSHLLLPFSRKIAWLLLEKAALVPTNDVESTALRANYERSIVRLAVAEISNRVVCWVDGEVNDEAKALKAHYTTRFEQGAWRWELAQEVDYKLWQTARDSFKMVTPVRWKLDETIGTVERV